MDILNPVQDMHVDGSDPAVAALAWFLTFLLGRLLIWLDGKKLFGIAWLRLRMFLPVTALSLAVGLRVAFDAMLGHPLAWETAFRAIGAGAVAVMSHVQVKQLIEKLSGRPRVAAEGDE